MESFFNVAFECTCATCTPSNPRVTKTLTNDQNSPVMKMIKFIHIFLGSRSVQSSLAKCYETRWKSMMNLSYHLQTKTIIWAKTKKEIVRNTKMV